MRTHRILLATVVVLVTATPAVLPADSSWTLRFHGAVLQSSAQESSRVGTGFENSVDIAGGLGFGVEYRLSERLGLELSTFYAGLRIEQRVSAGHESVLDLDLGVMPLTLAVPIHFANGRRVQLYAGPTFSVVRYLDLETRIGIGQAASGIEEGTESALGAAFGIDVPLGKGAWAFSAGLRYMNTGPGEVDLDPVIVTLGFAYRF